MQLFFDVDGVILNFNKAFYQVCNKLFDLKIPENYIHDNWYPYLGTKPVLTREQSAQAWDYFVNNRYFGKLELLDKKIPAILRNYAYSGYEINLVTSVPKESELDRINNLKKLGIFFDDFYNIGVDSIRNKSYFINGVYAGGKSFFIDDKFENCKDVAENCSSKIKILMMTYPYNENKVLTDVTRVYNWKDIVAPISGKR